MHSLEMFVIAFALPAAALTYIGLAYPYLGSLYGKNGSLTRSAMRNKYPVSVGRVSAFTGNEALQNYASVRQFTYISLSFGLQVRFATADLTFLLLDS
jgi:hypothetical protein